MWPYRHVRRSYFAVAETPDGPEDECWALDSFWSVWTAQKGALWRKTVQWLQHAHLYYPRSVCEYLFYNISLIATNSSLNNFAEIAALTKRFRNAHFWLLFCLDSNTKCRLSTFGLTGPLPCLTGGTCLTSWNEQVASLCLDCICLTSQHWKRENIFLLVPVFPQSPYSWCCFKNNWKAKKSCSSATCLQFQYYSTALPALLSVAVPEHTCSLDSAFPLGWLGDCFVVFAQGDLSRKKIYPTLWWVGTSALTRSFGSLLLSCCWIWLSPPQVVIQRWPAPKWYLFCRVCAIRPDSGGHHDSMSPFHEGRSSALRLFLRGLMVRSQTLLEISPQVTDEQNEFLSAFFSKNSYVRGRYDDSSSFAELSHHLSSLPGGSDANRLFYLALPPTVYQQVGTNISSQCMSDRCASVVLKSPNLQCVLFFNLWWAVFVTQRLEQDNSWEALWPGPPDFTRAVVSSVLLIQRGSDLPHWPLPGQRDGPEPHGSQVTAQANC